MKFTTCMAKTGQETLMVTIVRPTLIISELSLRTWTVLTSCGSSANSQPRHRCQSLSRQQNPRKKPHRIAADRDVQDIRTPVHAEELCRAVQAAIEPKLRKHIRVLTSLPVIVNDIPLNIITLLQESAFRPSRRMGSRTGLSTPIPCA